MSVHLLVVAAGRGSRFGADIPKQYLTIGKKTILEHTLTALADAQFDSKTLVVAKDDEFIKSIDLDTSIHMAHGGQERFDSVKAGVQAISNFAKPYDVVVIHDVARPCLLAKDLQAVIKAAQAHEVGAILAVPVADTLKSVVSGSISHTVSRESLWQAQTPQVFHLDKLLILIDFFENNEEPITDEASGFERMGLPVAVVQGSSSNIKLTQKSDLFLVEAILMAQGRI